DEAAQHFEAAIEDARAHADAYHEGAAYINRSVLWFARGDAERFFTDLREAVRIGRELGSAMHEYNAVVNIGEVEYLLADLELAHTHTLRGLELARQQFGDDHRELSIRELLLARIALYRGELAEAGAQSRRIRERIARAFEKGESDAELLASDAVLLQLIE